MSMYTASSDAPLARAPRRLCLLPTAVARAVAKLGASRIRPAILTGLSSA